MAANLPFITLTDGPGTYLLYNDGSILIVKGYGKDGQKVAANTPLATQMIKNLSSMNSNQARLIASVLQPSQIQIIANTPDLPSPTNPTVPMTNEDIEAEVPVPFYKQWWFLPVVGTTVTAVVVGAIIFWPDDNESWL